MVFNGYWPFGSIPRFGVSGADDSVAFIRDMNEWRSGFAKNPGRIALDTYEHALHKHARLPVSDCRRGQSECVAASASTHARFIEDITTAYIKATRDTHR